MYKDVSCTVKVPYKYNPTFEMGIDVTSNYSLSSGGSTGAVTIPQYVGTATLTAKDAGNSGVYASYKLYDNGKLTAITTSYSYQWYSSTTKDGTGSFISGAAKATHGITDSSTAGTTYYYYIVTASSSAPDFMISEENFATSDRQQITIQAYSLSLVSTAGESYTHGSGSSRTLTQEATYTVTLINDADTKLSEEGVAWSDRKSVV